MGSILPADYNKVLQNLKVQVRSAQNRAILAVNQELIMVYLEIGRLLNRPENGWGTKAVGRLARDLKAEFPDLSGFSRTNLYYMKQVYTAWKDADEFVQQLVGQIPWGHHILLVSKVQAPEVRAFYLQQTVEYGWSRAILTVQIESKLYTRKGKALTNFKNTLPEPASELAQQTLKDPYLFDFLSLSENAKERDLEQGLLDHIQSFLMELGVGFSFVGRQFNLVVGTRDFYLDLLFYHLQLRCFIVVELKTVPFEPEFVGKLNFYLSVVDDQLRHETDAPTIGLLLCKSKDRLIVEYALRDVNKPMGVAEWKTRLVESLPGDLEGRLPTVEDIEAEFSE